MQLDLIKTIIVCLEEGKKEEKWRGRVELAKNKLILLLNLLQSTLLPLLFPQFKQINVSIAT